MTQTLQNRRLALLRKSVVRFRRSKVAWKAWKDRCVKRYLLFRLNYHALVALWILLLQMQLKETKMARTKQPTTETTDQDQIVPEMETEPIKTKRGRPKSTSISGLSSSGKSNTKLDREIAAIEKSLAEMFSLGTVAAIPLSQISQTLAQDALIVADRGTSFLVPAIAAMARENPRLRAALLSVGENSAYVQLTVAVVAMAVPIAVNHGAIDEKYDRPFQALAQLKNSNLDVSAILGANISEEQLAEMIARNGSAKN